MHDGCEIPCHDFSPDWNIVTNNSGTTWLNGVALASLTSFTSSLPTLIWAHYLSQQWPHHKSERLFCLLFFRDWKSNQLNTELTRLIPARQRRNRKTSRGTATRTLFPVSLAQDFLISAADDTVNPTLAWVSETLLVCVCEGLLQFRAAQNCPWRGWMMRFRLLSSGRRDRLQRSVTLIKKYFYIHVSTVASALVLSVPFLSVDHSRVKLNFTTSKNDSDYINASFIRVNRRRPHGWLGQLTATL